MTVHTFEKIPVLEGVWLTKYLFYLVKIAWNSTVRCPTPGPRRFKTWISIIVPPVEPRWPLRRNSAVGGDIVNSRQRKRQISKHEVQHNPELLHTSPFFWRLWKAEPLNQRRNTAQSWSARFYHNVNTLGCSFLIWTIYIPSQLHHNDTGFLQTWFNSIAWSSWISLMSHSKACPSPHCGKLKGIIALCMFLWLERPWRGPPSEVLRQIWSMLNMVLGS